MGALELPSASSFIRKFLVGAIPKLVVLILSAIVAATIADLNTEASEAPSDICSVLSSRLGAPSDPVRRDRAPRICYLGVATSIISVFVALTLIQIEMVIFCAPGFLKRLAHGFGLLLSIMMCVFWIVTAGLLANLYREYCDDLPEPDECNDTDRRFIATPVLGFICLVGWAIIGLISIISLIKG